MCIYCYVRMSPIPQLKRHYLVSKKGAIDSQIDKIRQY